MSLPLLVALALSMSPQGDPCPASADTADRIAAHSVEVLLRLAQETEARCADRFTATLHVTRALMRHWTALARLNDINTRDLAERLARRAVKLQPTDARAWFELARLWRLRYGVTLDGRRAASRALTLASAGGDTLAAVVRAEILVEGARNVQQSVDRTRWLREASRVPVVTPACDDLGAFCENYTFPRRFNEQLAAAPERRQPHERLRTELLAIYGRAIALDSSVFPAARGYARELALAGQWAALSAFTMAIGRHQSPGFWLLVRATALVRAHSEGAAEELFREAQSTLPDSVARWLREPPPGMPPDWANRARPLWVTTNEIQLEYWSRVGLALLVFGDDEAGIEGPRTPQGEALLRYGWPRRVVQIARADDRAMTGAQIDAANQVLSCNPPDLARNPQGSGLQSTSGCEPAAQLGYDAGSGGGRWIFWTYETDRPSLVFEDRPIPGVAARYESLGRAREYAERLSRRTPFTFRSNLVHATLAMPAQTVRTRGHSPTTTLVRWYAAVPQLVREAADDSAVAGVYLFGRHEGFPLLWSHRLDSRAARGATLADSVEVAEGDFAFSLEVFTPAGRVAGVARDTLEAPQWPGESLTVSDVLVARNVVASGRPQFWRDLRITPNPTLRVQPLEPVWLVWETYGLRSGPDGRAAYDVSLRHEPDRPWHLRLLQRLGIERAPSAAGTMIQWTVERVLGGADSAVDAVQVTLVDARPGEARLTLEVSDPVTGRTAHRTFRVVVERDPTRGS